MCENGEASTDSDGGNGVDVLMVVLRIVFFDLHAKLFIGVHVIVAETSGCILVNHAPRFVFSSKVMVVRSLHVDVTLKT